MYYVNMYVCVTLWMYACQYVRMCCIMYVCMALCMYACHYGCMYVNMYVCMSIYYAVHLTYCLTAVTAVTVTWRCTCTY